MVPDGLRLSPPAKNGGNIFFLNLRSVSVQCPTTYGAALSRDIVGVLKEQTHVTL